MAVRHWNDDASELRVPVLTESDVTDACTLAALVSLSTKAGFQTLMAGVDSGGTQRWGFGINASRLPFWYADYGAGSHSITGQAGLELPVDTWCLIAVTVFSFGDRQFHVIPLGSTAVHLPGDLGGFELPASTAGGYISFGNVDGTDTVDGLIAIQGVWSGVALTDAQVEGLVTGLSSDDWANNATADAAGAWNYNQADPADPVPDLTGHHALISGTIDSSADLNGITGTTIVTGSDPSGWDFTFTPPPLRANVHLSGGAANTDPAASIGGALSSAAATGSLFDDVSPDEREAGLTDYRLVYLQNDDVDVTATVQVTAQLEVGQFAVGAATEAAGSTVTAIADDETAPGGVTFQPSSSVSLGTILNAQAKGVWVRRTVPAATPEGSSNPATVSFAVTDGVTPTTVTLPLDFAYAPPPPTAFVWTGSEWFPAPQRVWGDSGWFPAV